MLQDMNYTKNYIYTHIKSKNPQMLVDLEINKVSFTARTCQIRSFNKDICMRDAAEKTKVLITVPFAVH